MTYIKHFGFAIYKFVRSFVSVFVVYCTFPFLFHNVFVNFSANNDCVNISLICMDLQQLALAVAIPLKLCNLYVEHSIRGKVKLFFLKKNI